MIEKNNQENLLKDSLKKSIKCKADEYKIIFHSKSILLSQVIAEYLFEQLTVQKTTTLLLDLFDQEVDEIFNEIVCKKSLQLLRNPQKQTKIQLKRLPEVVKQKRSQLYKTAGVYSISTRILIMDLIRFQKIISLNSINRIIIRISQKITSYFTYFGWIITLLKKESKNCSVILLCRDVHYYTEFQSLEGFYRTFFCQKLVIWPFGRSQVHKSILKTTQKVNELKHYLQMTEQMKKNQQVLKSLLQFVEKQFNRFRTRRITGMDVLLKESVGQQLEDNSPDAFQTTDFKNIKFLMNCLQNCDSIYLMSVILGLRKKDSQKSIWNSNNSTVAQLFEEIQKSCKNRIFTIQKIQEPQKPIEINLVELITNYHYDRDQSQLAGKYDEWKALYELNYKIKPFVHKNHKVLEIYQIIDNILDQKQEKQKQTVGKEKKRIEQFEDYDLKDQQDLLERLLINCPNETSRRYLHKQLFNKVNNSHYIEYLRSVYHFLGIQRQLRIVSIKSIHSKIRQKKNIQKMEIQSYVNTTNPSQIQLQKSNQQTNNFGKQVQVRQSLERSLSSSQMLQAIYSMDQRLSNQFEKEKGNIGSQNLKQQQLNSNQREKLRTSQQTNNNQRHQSQTLIKQHQNLSKETKKLKKPAKQIFKQNTIILEECLYKELSILFQVLSRYQNQVFTDEQIRMNTSNSNKPNNQKSQMTTQRPLKFFQSEQISFKKKEQQKDKQDSLKLLLKNQSLAFQTLFQQEISRINFQFIDKNQLKVVPNYSEDAQFAFYSKRNPNKKVLILSLFSPKISSWSSEKKEDKVTEFNQAMKLINPERVIFYSPHPWQIRNVYISHSQGLLSNLTEIRVLAYKGSFQVLSAEHQVKKQDEAFWKISQNRMRLSEYKENPEMRIKDLEMNDKYEKTVDFINYAIKNDPKAQEKSHIYRLDLNQRRVIIDTRQFKSLLPCYLFFCGFTVVPIQLQTADYILSDHIGIQKKAVTTKDLHQSLKSFRLDKQVKRMCQKFQKPYLLIECEDIQDFKKESFFQKGLQNGKGGKDSYRVYIRQRLAQILKKFPKLRIIWSQSVNRTCEYFKQLKRNQPQPEIGKYMRNENQQTEKAKQFDSDESQQELQKDKDVLRIQQ